MINPNKRIWQASEIWKSFDFSLPFSAFLKNHFKQNKKYGKRDRAEISHVLYSYLRIGFNSKSLDFEKAAQIGLLLSDSTPEITLQELETPKNWLSYTLAEKVTWVEAKFELDFYNDFFESSHELSNGVILTDYAQKILAQSPVFIRVLRNGNHVISALKQAEFDFEEIDQVSIKLKADSKLHLLPKNILRDIYVQDLASQLTIEYLTPTDSETWWDACCGAGGKSILLKSVNPEIDITGTDIRKSILFNYEQRLKQHGFKPKTFVADLSKKPFEHRQAFDGVVIDAPCSGSGTWGRSPDGILRTSQLDIEKFVARQKAICQNAVKSLRPGGKLTYITCSIFKAENENITQFIADELKLKLIKQGIIHSAIHNSDYLFAAQFILEK